MPYDARSGLKKINNCWNNDLPASLRRIGVSVYEASSYIYDLFRSWQVGPNSIFCLRRERDAEKDLALVSICSKWMSGRMINVDRAKKIKRIEFQLIDREAAGKLGKETAPVGRHSSDELLMGPFSERLPTSAPDGGYGCLGNGEKIAQVDLGG